MSGDYKYEIQQVADNIAHEKFNKAFYDLSEDQKTEIYEEALEVYRDKVLAYADRLKDE